MTEAQLYEKIGRLQLAADDKDQAYGRLLDLLGKVITGEIDASRVVVNLTDRTWAFGEPGTRPAMPCQVNGLPVCVVAPEPSQVGPFLSDDHDEVFVSGTGLKVVKVLAAEPRINFPVNDGHPRPE